MIFSIRRDVAAISAGAIGAVLTNALEFAVAFIAGTVGEGVIPIASLMAAISDSGNTGRQRFACVRTIDSNERGLIDLDHCALEYRVG